MKKGGLMWCHKHSGKSLPCPIPRETCPLCENERLVNILGGAIKKYESQEKALAARDVEIERLKEEVNEVYKTYDGKKCLTHEIVLLKQELTAITKERDEAYIAIKKALDSNEATKILVFRIEEYQKDEWKSKMEYWNEVVYRTMKQGVALEEGFALQKCRLELALRSDLANEHKALELACQEVRYGYSHEKDLTPMNLPDHFRKKAREQDDV